MVSYFLLSSQINLADLWFLQVNISTLFDPTFVPHTEEINRYSYYFTTIHLHAIFMFIGWAVFINLNMIMKRYKSLNKQSKQRTATAIEKFSEVNDKKICFQAFLFNMYYLKIDCRHNNNKRWANFRIL